MTDDLSPATTPMPPQDAWLYRQQGPATAAAPVSLVAWFDGPAPTLAELRLLTDKQWSALPRLRMVPRAAPTAAGWPHWTDGGPFAPERHVHSGPGCRTELIGRLAADPLPTDRPPWQLHLLPTRTGFALLLRAHHALLDGISLGTLLDALLGLPPAEPEPGPEHHRPGPLTRLARLAGDLVPQSRRLPIHGSPGPGRKVAFATVGSTELAAARAALPAARSSGTAVFLAAAAGALHRLDLLGPARPGRPTALVPVDARGPEQRGLLGNRYATVRIPLPRHPDPRARLAELSARTSREQLAPRAAAQAALVAEQPCRTTALGTLLARYFDSPQYFSLLCSSLPAPAGPERTLGVARLTALAALPPLGPAHPVALTLHHHPTGATVAAVTDDRMAHLAEPLAAAVRAEIRLLARP
ncbi:wax ester/triacylglycerol synthase domain-containing protein [Kitasatospora sp. NPDC006697]|uniref:wax ester/triacylglycerol synthase domain-containing protein n=1 Tax=Kitasatospora sp. NPDC006697 TaxID=3364020 RepID=UPI0036AF05FC